MHRQRYVQILEDLVKCRKDPRGRFYTPSPEMVSKAHADLEHAASAYRTILQNRSRVSKNEIRAFIGSAHRMTPTKARLLEAAGLL